MKKWNEAPSSTSTPSQPFLLHREVTPHLRRLTLPRHPNRVVARAPARCVGAGTTAMRVLIDHS